MSESRHTPGPWIVQKGAGWLITRPDAAKRREAAIMVGMRADASLIDSPHLPASDDDEARANAYLMAAAPDMLAALEALMPEGWGADDTMDHMPGVKLARLAIAKARGPVKASREGGNE